MTVNLETLQNMGTREVGERARQQVLQLISSGETVQIDFRKSARVTPSFVDEFIGKLVAEIGQEKFQSCVKIINISPDVESLIQVAIARRLRVIPA